MGKTIMGAAAVSLDGFIADDNDEVGPLFDWLGTGDVSWSLPSSDDEARSTRVSADFMTSHYGNTAANVIGRRLFDLTNGWNGQPAAYEHVFVVTHQPPTGWEHALGLIDQVVMNVVPVVFGSGRPFFATGSLSRPLRLEDPTTIVRGDRVTHLVYDVTR